MTIPYPAHEFAQPSLKIRGNAIPLNRAPLIMGIVNINDDSFSGDGRLDPGWALERARTLAEEGAHIIDFGAESARTNRPPISEEEEIRRLTPVLEACGKLFPNHPSPPLFSINTWRPGVVKALLLLGGDLVNDMGGLPDDRIARLCAHHGAALVIMHTAGLPKIPQTHVTYGDIIGTLHRFFEKKIALAVEAGLPREALILDPGIDFAKQAPDNLTIYRDLGRLRPLGRPILLPISRKGVIGRVLGIASPAKRDPGTAACLVAGILRGATIIRVHNVTMAREAIATVRGVMAAGLSLKDLLGQR